jgi:hypothetical protein
MLLCLASLSWGLVACGSSDEKKVACEALDREEWVQLQGGVTDNPSTAAEARSYAEAMAGCSHFEGWTRQRTIRWLGPPTAEGNGLARWFLGGDDDAEFFTVRWNSDYEVFDIQVSP